MTLSLKPVEAARGARWVGDAWRLFIKRPVAFTALFVVFLFAALLVSLVPLLGLAAQMMSLPLLSLGFMVASQSALLDGPVHPRQFIEPLRSDARRRRALLTLCVLYGLSAMLTLVLVDAVSDGAWGRLQALLAQGDAQQAQVDAILAEPGVVTGGLLGALLALLLSVPFWHAPALVHWGGQTVGQSLFSSSLALWRAKGAFFVYGMTFTGLLLLSGFTLAAVLGLLGAPQLAGLLALPLGLTFSALFYVSLLFSFNDCFGGKAVPPMDDDYTRPDPG
jgi:hypothetical protein